MFAGDPEVRGSGVEQDLHRILVGTDLKVEEKTHFHEVDVLIEGRPTLG